MAHWPQILTLISLASYVPGHAYGAGRKSTSREAWVHFITGIVRCAVPFFVLYAGGFFAPLGWGAP